MQLPVTKALINNRTMIKLFKIDLKKIFAFAALGVSLTAFGQQKNTQPKTGNGAFVLPGRKGVWVICGDALPKNFTYKVLRQDASGNWSTLGDATFPKSKEDVQAALLNVQRLADIPVEPLSDIRLDGVWDRITSPVAAVNPPEMLNQYPLRQATGTAFYDGTATINLKYKYRVQVIGGDGKVNNEVTSEPVSFPGAKFSTQIKPLMVKPTRSGIYAEFELTEKGPMITCKIFRSYYLRSGYEEINAQPSFLTRNGKTIATFVDNTVSPKVPYSYILLPVDAAGNVGDFSPELRAFNVPEKSIQPSVTNFRTASVETEKAIKLSWTLKNKQNITSVDIFKGDIFDGNYIKIASLQGTDSVYMDHAVRPIETYYYTIKLNGNFEESPVSPRVPGILKASNKNLFPPQDLRAAQRGNQVKLRWKKNEPDTRAYYVYRATAPSGKFQQITPAIVNDSTYVSYIDNLPVTANPVNYVYAVADENTSYAIGPRSNPVMVYMQNAELPIPYDVVVRRNSAGYPQVIWPNMQKNSPVVGGYALYRRSTTPDGKIADTLKKLAAYLPAKVNQFTDSTAQQGRTYYYSVRTINNGGDNQSSPSLEAGFTIAEDVPNPVANIRVFAAGKSIILKWDNPMGEAIKSVKVLRATEGKQPAEIAALNAASENYTDKDVAAGSVYYYCFVVENSKGKTSYMTQPVGIRL
jgi:fibronectin type 3 domain-containing protein